MGESCVAGHVSRGCKGTGVGITSYPSFLSPRLNHSLMARLARESERAQEATEEAQRLRKEVDLLERRFAALSASAEQRSGAGDTAREGEGRGADAQHVLMAEMERQLEASCSQVGACNRWPSIAPAYLSLFTSRLLTRSLP